MGILKPANRSSLPIDAERLPSGCFSVHRSGGLVASTLPSWFSPKLTMEIARTVLDAFRNTAETTLPLNEMHVHFGGFTIIARELRGGALIFLQPQSPTSLRHLPPPAMNYKNLEDFILHLEAHIECWKQFNHYVNLARDKKFSNDDEVQFLELKSLITQGAEAISASEAKSGPKKEEIQGLFATSPSLRYLADMSDTIPSVEGQWHRIYLSLQSLLGQLKVQHNKAEERGGWSLFGRK